MNTDTSALHAGKRTPPRSFIRKAVPFPVQCFAPPLHFFGRRAFLALVRKTRYFGIIRLISLKFTMSTHNIKLISERGQGVTSPTYNRWPQCCGLIINWQWDLSIGVKRLFSEDYEYMSFNETKVRIHSIWLSGLPPLLSENYDYDNWKQ